MTDWEIKHPIPRYHGTSFHDRKVERIRLAERAVCEAEHMDLLVPDNGFGWTGTRCSKCGFMFFVKWEDWVFKMTKEKE